jgi:hypothetical protein
MRMACGFAEAEENGFAFVESVFDLRSRIALLQTMRRFELTEMPPRVGSVEQHASYVTISASEWDSSIRRVAALIANAAKVALEAARAPFEPNEAMCQRYENDEARIGPHFDSNCYENFVVVITLEGHALFKVYGGQKETSESVEYQVAPGDVVILRGAGSDSQDGRPRHEVGPPIDSIRTSLTLRQRAEDRATTAQVAVVPVGHGRSTQTGLGNGIVRISYP